ncbi:MAG: beta-ketoacyl-ACP synthase II [Bacteroidota bacterium]
MKRVAVTGMGALTPIGNNIEMFWEGLRSGKSGAGPISKFNATHFKTKFACELKDFSLENFFDRKTIRKNDLFTLYSLIASEEAMTNSGLNIEEIDVNKFGVIWASGNGGISTFEQEVIEYARRDQGPRFSPFFIPKILSDTPSGAVALKYGLRGINYCTVSACASGNSAIMDAYNYIRWGKANLMIAGGSEAPITQAGIGGFNAMKALSTRNDDPSTASRPFDKQRDGFVMGEGAGALILEELEHAEARDAQIYGEIVGCGMSNDAYHSTATHPEGLGARLAIDMALEEAQISPNEIDYINLHATSTPVGDQSELSAISRLFQASHQMIRVSATKSMTGHLLGAAGAIEAVATIMAMKYNTIPPTINTTNPDDDLPKNIDLTLGTAAHHTIKYAMSNTFGFGGHNAIALFKKWE